MGFADDLRRVQEAGYTSSPNSAAQQILNVISQVPDNLRKQQERRVKDEAEQVKLFIALREAGYSEEDATNRVNRAHRSTNFIEELLTGKSQSAFQPPTEDTTAAARLKGAADIKKTEAETKKLEAETASLDPKAAVPEGFVRLPGGKIQKDPTYKRPLTQQERQTKLQDEIDKKELSSMAAMLPKLDQADQSIGQLKELFYKGVNPTSVGKGNAIKGALARAAGPFKAAGAAVGANADLNRYKANREGFAGLIAKGGFGEAGVLTQQDIERIQKLLPDEGSTKEEAEIAFTEIEQLLASARKRFEDRKAAYMGRKGGVDEEEPAGDETEDFSGLWS